MDEREKALVEAVRKTLLVKGVHTVLPETANDLRQALKAYAAYPTMCMSPQLCACLGYCPREIACDD